MFKKLLTNLPFNPSLLGQVGFYTERLRRETFFRGAGIVTLALAIIIQTFAIVSPPQSSLAKSPNDIIYGGFTTRDQAVLYCLDQNKDIHLVFEYYGLNCDIIANAETVTINSTDYGKNLNSLGRVPQPATNPQNGKPSDQYAVNIPGVEQLYMKNLWYWDTYSSSSYKVLKMTNTHGQTVFIMYDCGNLITVGKYTPPAPAPAPTPKPTPTPSPTPIVDKCPNIPGVQTSTTQCDVCPNVVGTQTSLSQCDVCPALAGIQTSVLQCDVCPNVAGIQTSRSQCDVCPNIPGEQSNQNQCYPCPAAQTNTSATACMQFTKKAANQTRGIDNANGTTANSNDIIAYSLTATNKGKTEFKDFVFDENLADVLEYSGMNDYGGGTLTNNQHLVWPKRSIAPGETMKVQFSVKVKSPIPNTPRSSSDPASYDLCMTNVFYGETVTICVKPPLSKQVEAASTSLPNTGPGSSMFITFGIVSIMGYFFARNRTMVDELDIVRHEFTSGAPV